MSLSIGPFEPTIDVGDPIYLTVGGDIKGDSTFTSVKWKVVDEKGKEVKGVWSSPDSHETIWRAVGVEPGVYWVHVSAKSAKDAGEHSERILVRSRTVSLREPVRIEGPVRVDLERPGIPDTPDLPLWEIIKLSSEAFSYRNYEAFMNYLFCGGDRPAHLSPQTRDKRRLARGERWQEEHDRYHDPDEYKKAGSPLPFPDIHAYKVLKEATEAFMLVHCEIAFERSNQPGFFRSLSAQDRARVGLEPGDSLQKLWDSYLEQVNGDRVIPYLALVRANLQDTPLTNDPRKAELCGQILRAKVTNPCLLELIWSYWHEEGMLVQTLNAISMRFQNRRGPARVDPLANMTIDPLRSLSNLLWGYIQDEQHRLSLARRAYEYDHEYGMTLLGQAVPEVRAADSRSKFLEAFHNLLHKASLFYKEDDDTTMIADAFPALNALREVHLLLAEGADNAYGDLPWTARHEMLMQQWLLARPEFRQFLPTRPTVVYPEQWMDRVDAMKSIQGWTDTSVRYFRDLGVFGEQILLSIRFGNWSDIFDRDQAGNWARFWRQEVQWYIHAYQAVTGVDLSSDMADVRLAEQARARALPPAFHLQRRMIETRRASGVSSRQPVGPPPGMSM